MSALRAVGDDDEPTARVVHPVAHRDVNVHVFGVSAGLVGVCLTVIGVIRIGINTKPGYETIADELLAFDTVLFMLSCLLAYSSLRSPVHARARSLELYADRLFVCGLVTMCVAGGFVALSFV